VLIRKDGSERAIDDSAAPIRDDQDRISGSVLVFRDVSERRRVESERANQLLIARRLAAIVESSDDAIVGKSLDGVIQSWNAGAERIFGYTAAQAVGRHISLIVPADRLDEEERILASLKAGQRVDHYETERMRADGTRLQVSLTISPIRDEHGNVVGASKVARDVTQQRRAIERERELLTDLRHLADDLSEADRRKDEFLAMLAHELRNPLATISNAAGILRIGGDDADTSEGAATMLARQVSHMTRLVDDLLDVSRISRGSVELRKERTELQPIVEHALESTRGFCSSLGHRLEVRMPPQPIRLDADPTRLAQVLGNLLNNACKFTERGGNVALVVERDADQVVIRVRDDGIGIAPDQLPRLFAMFTQLDTSLERARDGLGIGLTLAKTLVELHGGTIEAKSGGLGRGSEFVVRLPLARDAATPEAQPELAAPAQPAPNRRILIVDDNEDAATSLALLLALHGHETHTASDGPEALEAVERLRPDTVLLDIGLPGMNGRDVCRRIREKSWGKEVLLVALTGWGQQEDRQSSAEAGFDAHLVKPVDVETLSKLLASAPDHPRLSAPTR
jgi:PAS domain S-box-containing protein